jgi:dipeptidyl aminopeptidase/acylaminoacyl peptidase
MGALPIVMLIVGGMLQKAGRNGRVGVVGRNVKFLWKLFVCFGIAAFLGGCAVSLVNTPETGANELIAAHAFFSNRDSNFAYKISPDGKKLAWIAVKGTSLALYIRDLDSGRTYTKKSYDIRSFSWTRDGRRLVTDSLVRSGTAKHVIGVLSVAEGADAIAVYSPGWAGTSRIISQIAGDDDHILVANNARDQRYFDLYKVSLSSNQHELIAANDGATSAWLADTEGRLAGRIVVAGVRNVLQVLSRRGDYADMYEWSDDDRVEVLAISGALHKAYLLSNKGSDRMSLVSVDTDTGETSLIHEHPTVDVSTVFTDPISGAPLVAVSEPDYPQNVVLDPRLKRVADFLAERLPARLAIENTDDAVRKLMLSLTTDTGREYYLADLGTGRLQPVGTASTSEFRKALRSMRSVELPSRDGTVLHGYLTLPDTAGASPQPLIVLPHGGPWERTVWAYDARTQFLANRGYAVLDINFRGSIGYGRQFQALGYGEWGGKMQDDLDDAVAWAVAQGVAAHGKVGIMGGSYGGYAAAMGLIGASETYSCGIAVNAPLDLVDLVENLPPEWNFDAPLLKRYIGDPAQSLQRALIQRRSPAFQAERLSRPLLLVQGAEDDRVSADKADAFAQSAWRAGSPLEFWSVPGAGHVFSDWKTMLKLYRKSEQFFARCLGGVDGGFDLYELGYYFF